MRVKLKEDTMKAKALKSWLLNFWHFGILRKKGFLNMKWNWKNNKVGLINGKKPK